MSKQLTELSKFLSYILRHEPQSIGLTLDANGWASIDELISLAANAGKSFDLGLLQQVVDTSDKKRFTLSADGLSIRAAQGHSSEQVNINYEAVTPPSMLYHGTATRFLDSIRAQGLLSGQRHYVHLSESVETASRVGERYGKLHLLAVDCARMSAAGFEFFRSENNVWLTKHVPAEYISDSRES
jgi:putative RNA 2'-phosphotransferase